VANTYVLIRMRGPSTMIAIPLPQERSAIELQMFPSSTPERGRFRVSLGQLDAANAVAPVAETHATANSADGFVRAYLDSARLGRGRYAIELQPEGAAPGAPGDRFIVEVR
jgi:hypothetical protein